MNLEIKLNPLNIISAGAGSGKTYIVQKTLSNWLENKEIEAQKILAVTFTKMAASEMQTRIKGALLSSGKLEDSVKIERAQISTIHSFGQEIVQSFVYEQGMSPNVRQLNEEEQNILLQQSLSSQKEIISIIKDLESLGYKSKYTGKDFIKPVDFLQNRIMQIISSFRTIPSSKVHINMHIDELKTFLTSIYGEKEDAVKLNKELQDAVKLLISSFPKNLNDEDESVAENNDAFNKDFKNLQKALDMENIETSMDLWKSLQTLRVTKVKNKDYKSFAQDVMEKAKKLSVHPKPLEMALYHIEILLSLSSKILDEYNEAKRKNSLMDFSDMLYLANTILNNDEYIKEISENFDCLVIDEFQDTNPIQFSLLWKFQQYGIPTLIVGDLKQSIMGFQGADSSLFKSLINTEDKNTYKLEQNWRTTPELMEWVNLLGQSLYKKDYIYLEPKANFPSTIPSMNIIDFNEVNWSANGKPKTGHKAFGRQQYRVIVQEIIKLLNTNQTIYDKDTAEIRPIRPNDIAILAPSHSMLGNYSKTLREYGIEASVKEDGFKSSIIMQVLFYALSYLVNKKDSYAALYLITTYMGDMELEDAIKMYIDESNKKTFKHNILEKIDSIRDEQKTFSISKKLIAVIDILGLWDFILEHEDSIQERANLLKLIQLSNDFELLQVESLHALGIYGKNINTFLTWFNILEEDKKPNAKSINTQAVNLLTWHASKGLEWPVVVVTGLDTAKSPKLPDVSIGYSENGLVKNPIDNAFVKFIPEFQDKDTNEKYLDTLLDDANNTIDNLLYVSMTRAREQLIISWPSFNEKKPKEQTFFHKLKKICKMEIAGDEMYIDDKKLSNNFKFKVTEADIDEDMQGFKISSAVNYGRSAINKLQKQERIPLNITPSMLTKNKTYIDLNNITKINYSSPININNTGLEPTILGTLLHRCYEVLLEGEEFSSRFYENVKEDLSKELFDNLHSQIKKLKTYLIDEKKIKTIQSEVPILFKDNQGSVISGFIDLLVETEDGYHIIDHKSDNDIEDFNMKFEHHYPQLMAYAQSVKLDKPVLSVGINWIRYGEISFNDINIK